jgi:hypothetical protein
MIDGEKQFLSLGKEGNFSDQSARVVDREEMLLAECFIAVIMTFVRRSVEEYSVWLSEIGW